MVLTDDLRKSLEHERDVICRDDALMEASYHGTGADMTGCGDEGDGMMVGGDININVPSADQAKDIAATLTGNPSQGTPQPSPQPIQQQPSKSFIEKWWLPLTAAAALTWFVARDFITPQDKGPTLNYRQMDFGLIDDSGKPVPFVKDGP